MINDPVEQRLFSLYYFLATAHIGFGERCKPILEQSESSVQVVSTVIDCGRLYQELLGLKVEVLADYQHEKGPISDWVLEHLPKIR